MFYRLMKKYLLTSYDCANKVLNRLKVKTDACVHTNCFAYGKKQRRKHNYPKFKLAKTDLNALTYGARRTWFSSKTMQGLL